ncbi:hypothetical protein PT974_12101 [Cladobotryum mycophilum]|uniref:Zn(2)-C6 fungal-type domain-containing protein n=1 Tax=Cladobotryum mycophilum TaxID=491253 RepID=A0ABR0S861_9HYPO
MHYLRRHLKCDETKPSCKKCLKWIGTCGGYEDLNHSGSSTPEPIITTPFSSPLGSPAASGDVDSSGCPSPISNDGCTSYPTSPGLSSAFITSHCEETIEVLQPILGQLEMQMESRSSIPDSRAFEADFWRETVPALVRDNLAVRYANTAVLTLIFANSAVGLEGNHYGKALSHYGQALRLVREASASEDALRSAILCSMFFVIFEIMNQDTKAAEAHLWNGERMLHELQETHPRAGGMSSSLQAELRCALQFLMLQADSPDLNKERAGYLEAFVQMATNIDRITNNPIGETNL